MKYITPIARILLGLVFFIFGLNGFLAFIPPTPMPSLAMQFLGALAQSHYMTAVFAVELIGGLLLLSGRFVPLALTLLGPVIFNIVLFHLFLAPAGLPIAILVAIFWLLTAYRYRSIFTPLLQPSAAA